MRIRSLKNKKGFTLLELLVSVTIIGIVLTVVLWNQNKFSNDIDVANLAYRVALAVREAQIYGVSVKSIDNQFSQAYGVHFYFKQNDPNDPSRKSLLVYADLDGDSVYDSDHDQGQGNDNYETTTCPQNSECVERLEMNRGNKIVDVCFIEASGEVVECLEGAGGDYANIHSLDILFKRPNPDAIYSTYSQEGNIVETGGLNSISICLESTQGKKKEVVVYSTGQISVVENCTPKSGLANGYQGTNDPGDNMEIEGGGGGSPGGGKGNGNGIPKGGGGHP